jgi:hypothetical protein
VSLKAIIDDVQAQLDSAGVTGVTFLFGGEHTLAHGSGARVVWVPRGGPSGRVEGPGNRPRPLYTRNVSVEAHIWGYDTASTPEHYGATETLFNQVAAAVHRSAHGSYTFDNELWPDLNGELLAHGRVIIATFTFRIPITDTPVATATATALSLTQELTVPTP